MLWIANAWVRAEIVERILTCSQGIDLVLRTFTVVLRLKAPRIWQRPSGVPYDNLKDERTNFFKRSKVYTHVSPLRFEDLSCQNCRNQNCWSPQNSCAKFWEGVVILRCVRWVSRGPLGIILVSLEELKTPKIQIFATSRPHLQDIKNTSREAPVLEISVTKQDIVTVVRGKVTKLCRDILHKDPELASLIIL